MNDWEGQSCDSPGINEGDCVLTSSPRRLPDRIFPGVVLLLLSLGLGRGGELGGLFHCLKSCMGNR